MDNSRKAIFATLPLEKLYESRDEWTLWLRVAPELEALRSDARFVSLLERIGFGK